MEGILGRKLGMTQIYEDDGTAIPVTVVEAGPCLVVQRKTQTSDGYGAVQVGLVGAKPPRHTPKPMQGHFKKAEVPPVRWLREFPVEGESELKPGDEIRVSMFQPGDYVDVVGTGKGKGFQGVMKRHGFHGGRATHGSMFHRAPGSIGCSAWPSRVYPGTKLPGRMGGHRVTTKNLRVVKVDEEQNLIYLKGAVPGGGGGLVAVKRAKRG